MTAPRTAEGQALLALWKTAYWTGPPWQIDMAERILAIEAEAAAPLRAALTFEGFARVNRERCEAADGFGHPLDGWTLSDWFLAAMGEFGEGANKAKKLNRVRDGIPGNIETPDELRAGLADEIADAYIYLDLLAQSQGFDMGTIIASKFDRTSEKIGAPHRAALAQPERGGDTPYDLFGDGAPDSVGPTGHRSIAQPERKPMRPDWTIEEGTGAIPIEQAGYLPQAQPEREAGEKPRPRRPNPVAPSSY